MKLKTVMLLISVALFQSCNNDSDVAPGKGQTQFEITDAPSDDANIEGVFVTVADIKVDGESVGMASSQTINLKAYANGSTKILGTADLDARDYSTITLVLDNAKDASGNTPGNYVMTTDQNKYTLTGSTTGTTEIILSRNWSVTSNNTTHLVLDFDLRKAIAYDNNSNNVYHFVTDDQLSAAVRVVDKISTGTIEGTYQEDFTTNADLVLAFVYPHNQFDMSSESDADANGLRFKHAVSSTVVQSGLSSNTYQFDFIEEGDYDLVFAVYSKNTQSNKFEFNTLVQSQTKIGGNVADKITVNAGANVEVAAVITGLLI